MQMLPNRQNVKPLGRTAELPDGLWLCHSCTGAEFTVEGTTVSVTVAADDRGIPMRQPVRLGLYVDGQRVIDAMLDTPEKVLTYSFSETPRKAIIRVLKLSEAAMSTCCLRSIEADGDIRPTAPRAKRIELIGDSITCGYGVDETDPKRHFRTETEDASRAWAYLAAEMLGADASLVALSGYGIISGHTSDAPVTNQRMERRYDVLAFSHGKYEGHSPMDTPWDFTQFPTDLVVVNLGTNDNSYVREDPIRAVHYRAAYTAFLFDLRRCNPQAYILCTLGMAGDQLYPQMEAAVSDYISLTGDKRVTCMSFTPQKPEDGYAADGHPSLKTQALAAEKLAAHVRELMDW